MHEVIKGLFISGVEEASNKKKLEDNVIYNAYIINRR